MGIRRGRKRAKLNNDAAKSFFKQGFDDAVTSGWFRWRRHTYLNAYRNGFNHGIRSKSK